jgi:hypothetical protein
LQPSDSVLGEEDSHLDGASTSQPHDGSTKLQSVGERSEHEKSKPDSSMTSSVQNEKDGQVNESHWRDVANAYVNRYDSFFFLQPYCSTRNCPFAMHIGFRFVAVILDWCYRRLFFFVFFTGMKDGSGS